MEITEVRVKLTEEAGDRLQAFCSITLDHCFVIRDLKIIEGTHGPFVAMPSRKLTTRCPGCGCKNHLRAAFCNQCGAGLRGDRAPKDDSGRAKLYADIAHPINSACREMLQERIIREYHAEIERSKQPGYVPSYDDFDVEGDYTHAIELPPEPRPGAPRIAPHSRGDSSEHTRVQPPQTQPGPHKRSAAAPSDRRGKPRRDDFGAGIL
ncbi:MAG: septation protein SpoVG family protein [Pirellulales bacterium]|nr:septation protein SpoVG family protein [Pirellulales bacterium]